MPPDGSRGGRNRPSGSHLSVAALPCPSVTDQSTDLAPNAHRFAPLTDQAAERWATFPDRGRPTFPTVVGLVIEEIRTDYARMRLPHRSELEQPDGVVHGGAIATLVDTVVVPAIGGAYEARMDLFTVSMTVNYLGAVVGEDAVAEGWVERRGRSTVFSRVEVRTAGRGLATTATLVYAVRPARAV